MPFNDFLWGSSCGLYSRVSAIISRRELITLPRVTCLDTLHLKKGKKKNQCNKCEIANSQPDHARIITIPDMPQSPLLRPDNKPTGEAIREDWFNRFLGRNRESTKLDQLFRANFSVVRFTFREKHTDWIEP